MADTIMHCFDPGSAEAEGKIIGSLLAGYGELELEMAAETLPQPDYSGRPAVLTSVDERA
jgi:hypothetical protein